MKPAPFTYLLPESLEEACAALARHGEAVRPLAGGQSLGAMLNLRLLTPAFVLDLNRIPGLDRITEDAGGVATGALVRQADALASPAIRQDAPLLALALPHVGHYQTRSRGTLGGSVAHADPSAEIPLALLVAGGAVELRSARGRRRVAAGEFFRSALVTARRGDELVAALHWPRHAGARWGFAEFALRRGDYALAAAACRLALDGGSRLADLALGFAGIDDRPVLAPVEEFRGERAATGLAERIAAAAAGRVPCKGDLHAPAAYRRQLVLVLARRALAQAFEG
jgi:2-furoyl-CoA dehydrogenase FAD binding subunit